MILDKFKLNGKVAVVTGAGRGLGKARRSARRSRRGRGGGGHRSAPTKRARRCGRSAAASARSRPTDGRASVPAHRRRGVKELGGIDILLNNAGIIRRAPLLEFSEKDWDDVININLKRVFFLSQAVRAADGQAGRGGKIINIASMLSFQGGIRVPSYTASKSAVMGLTRLIANELGAAAHQRQRHRARLHGDRQHRAAARRRSSAARKSSAASRPGRWGEPEDLQGALVFLASAASDYVNGYTIAVDGGWLAR